MVFSSPIFLFILLPITILVYIVLYGLESKASKISANNKWHLSNIWLLLVSLLFYGWSKPAYLLILFASIAINYIGGFILSWQKSRRTFTLWLFVGLNLLLLYYFKYINFTKEIINSVKGSSLAINDIALPLGISFFTFSGISYIVDTYRDPDNAEQSLLNISLYLGMFTKVAQGPIEKYSDMKNQFSTKAITVDDFYYGVQRLIYGLFKKVIIADNIAIVTDGIYSSNLQYLSTGAVWLGTIAYTLQVFFDFSGYSDMAIGIARMLGFRFSENFDYPYTSKSISEFWRRWHITLSNFYKNYVYIPLGGNRKHVYLNLAIVFLLTGIWHGANYTFIFWGILNGAFILIERYIIREQKSKSKYKPGILLSTILHIYTLLIVNFGWVFFRSPDMKTAFSIIKRMFGIGEYTEVYTSGWWLTNYNIFIFLIAIILSTPLLSRVDQRIQKSVPETVYIVAKNILLVGVLVVCIMHVATSTYSSFIYFQF